MSGSYTDPVSCLCQFSAGLPPRQKGPSHLHHHYCLPGVHQQDAGARNGVGIRTQALGRGPAMPSAHFTLVLFKPMSFREGSLKKGFERQSARREGKRYLPSAGSPPKGHSTQQFPVGQGPAPRMSLPVSHMGGRSPASVWSSVDCYQHLGSELVPRELCRIINKM